MATSKLFIPDVIDEQDIVFNKDSNYHKQKKQEKKNPVFKQRKSKKTRK